MSEAFGPRLRALRSAKGLSLTELARRSYYSKGHVSRVETGRQAPSVEFAHRCDAVLGAGGELVALVPVRSRRPVRGDHRVEHDEAGAATTAVDSGTPGATPSGRVGGTTPAAVARALREPRAPRRPSGNGQAGAHRLTRGPDGPGTRGAAPLPGRRVLPRARPSTRSRPAPRPAVS